MLNFSFEKEFLVFIDELSYLAGTMTYLLERTVDIYKTREIILIAEAFRPVLPVEKPFCSAGQRA